MKYISLLFLVLFTNFVFAEDFEAGLKEYKNKNFSIAADIFGYAAEKGNVQAQCNLGAMYFNGEGVSKSYKQAFKWFNLAFCWY